MRDDKLRWPIPPYARPPSFGLPTLSPPRMPFERGGRCSKVWMLSVTFQVPDASTSSEKREGSRRQYPRNCWLKSRSPGGAGTKDLHSSTLSKSCWPMVMLTPLSTTCYTTTTTPLFHSSRSEVFFNDSISTVPEVALAG